MPMVHGLSGGIERPMRTSHHAVGAAAALFIVSACLVGCTPTAAPEPPGQEAVVEEVQPEPMPTEETQGEKEKPKPAERANSVQVSGLDGPPGMAAF